jgi:hypothetical protein
MELFLGVMQTRRPVCALVLRTMFFSVAVETGALINNSPWGMANDNADYRNGLVFCQTGKLKARGSGLAEEDPRFARTGTR